MSNRSYNSNPMTVGLEPKSSFNSPWECRIGLTLVEFVEADEPDMYFQFPVGMSNRSYREFSSAEAAKKAIFQFPVGMSNRSYNRVLIRLVQHLLSFNSPWECRIGLTDSAEVRKLLDEKLPFNSPWECRIGLTPLT